MLTTGRRDLPTVVSQNSKHDGSVVNLVHDSCKTDTC